ncbi:hypothetical protein [Lentilitoribacter sp. EG35]|uniref:hypothetical protein n=1 Tax=Lentilitoribacter sp. EG35 TaxID=3234192 RepID=UPI00345F5261
MELGTPYTITPNRRPMPSFTQHNKTLAKGEMAGKFVPKTQFRDPIKLLLTAYVKNFLRIGRVVPRHGE